VLYAVVEEYAEAFFARLGEQGASLPAFVHEEFARYLRCGRLEEGFVRVVCIGCRHEHLDHAERRDLACDDRTRVIRSTGAERQYSRR